MENALKPKVDGSTEYLCSTCNRYLMSKKPKIPKLCYKNGLEFPEIPPELKDLTTLEERLVSGRLPFMIIKKLGVDRQCGLKGNIINILNPINETAKILPRQFNEASVVQVISL